MENDLKQSFRRGHNKGLGFGFFLVIIGIVLLGFNFGYIDSPLKRVIFSWPMILIVTGTAKFYKKQFVTSIILFMIGIFFLMPRIIHAYPEAFPGLDGSFTHTFWPLLLIAAGIIMVVNKLTGNKWNRTEWDSKHHHKDYANYEGPIGSFSKNSVFGGGEHIVLEPEFKGGELNAVFGGMTLNLRHTNLPEGVTRLEVNAVFGGVTIIVPEDWMVETHLDSVFGGFEDKRLVKIPQDNGRKLIITGACVFGGGEIRN